MSRKQQKEVWSCFRMNGLVLTGKDTLNSVMEYLQKSEDFDASMKDLVIRIKNHPNCEGDS